jgi:hypothetical protein
MINGSTIADLAVEQKTCSDAELVSIAPSYTASSSTRPPSTSAVDVWRRGLIISDVARGRPAARAHGSAAHRGMRDFAAQRAHHLIMPSSALT